MGTEDPLVSVDCFKEFLTEKDRDRKEETRRCTGKKSFSFMDEKDLNKSRGNK